MSRTRRIYSSRWRFAAALGLLLASPTFVSGSVSLAAEANDGRSDLVVDDPRPVAKAIEVLTSRHGYWITYEDPRYAYAGDIADVTSAVRQDLSRYAQGQSPTVLVPLGGRLELNYSVSTDSRKPADAGALIQRVLDVQATRSTGGTYRLERVGQIFHVVPAQVRDRNGEWIKQTSVLNVPITIPEAERDGLQMLQAICDEASKQTSKKVVVGTVPLNLLARIHAVQHATNENARDVLVRTLDLSSSKVTWQILYDPKLEWHIVNLRVIGDKPQPERDSKPLPTPVDRSGSPNDTTKRRTK